jgi:UDP-N-acetylglucosamine 4,6-dehydratase
MFDGKSILITGGTGSFGKKFIEMIFAKYSPKKVIIYSRDEYKQFLLKQKFSKELSNEKFSKLRFFIGDVRDKDRLYRAFSGVDLVIHAAALKQVPSCEYNPFEAIKTNIGGAQNVIDAALDRGVQKVVALSTDKAVNPINLYGGTKLVSDKLFASANVYSGEKGTIFSVVRYGNVAGSRGSVIPFFKSLIESGEDELPITDYRMTRFWITLEEGVNLVFRALKEAKGGETYVAKLPSFKVTDLAKAMKEDCKLKEVGIREGEKIHEVMISKDDSRRTYEYEDHYIIYPQYNWWNSEKYLKNGGKRVEDEFEYSSGTNKQWLSVEDLRERLKNLKLED